MEAAILAPDDFMSIGLEMVGFNRSYCVKSYTVTPPLGEPHISCDYACRVLRSLFREEFFSIFREEFFSKYREEFFSK